MDLILHKRCDPEERPGKIREIHSGFHNFIDEGDERLKREMVKAGLRLQGTADADGKLRYEIVQQKRIMEADQPVES